VILLFALCWTLLVAFLLARAVGQFRAYPVLAPAHTEEPTNLPSLAVVVPARNESNNIARCLKGLTAQDYPGEFRVTVVDDGSTDDTADLARRLCSNRDGFKVVPADTLPAGWIGKSHACWQGARQSGEDWLCFLDADTWPGPLLMRTAVIWAEGNRVDMLSLEPEQELVSFWERIILPAGMFMLAFFLIDLRAINDPGSPETAANGQFILIRRQIYNSIGGHEAVRAEISEDLALARQAKAAGWRTRLMGTDNLLRVRMFHCLGEIWEGLSKNAVNQADSRSRAALIAGGGLFFAWISLLLPAAAVIAWIGAPGAMDAAAATLAVAASMALLLTHMAGARYFGLRPAYGLLFPLGYTLVAAIVFNSLRIYKKGSVRWKGRRYAPPAPSSPEAGYPARERKSS
jgi:chlorobactene glucosyltransferase